MNILSAGDPRAAATILAAAKAASAKQKATVDAAVGQARGSARFAPSDTWKQMAKAKVQELIERVRILKKLYSGDPREMARMLAQVFKELKAAVRAYKDATGEELGMAGDVAAGAVNAVAPPGSGSSAAASTDAPAKASDGQTADGQSTDGHSGDGPAVAGGASAYAQVTQDVREGLGQDALDFAKDVRELARNLSDLLETARGQARAARPSKETSRTIEDADKALSDLRQGLDSLERDVRQQVPTLGLRISVAA